MTFLFFVLFCTFVASFLGHPNTEKECLTETEKWLKWVRFRGECQQETNVSDISIAKSIMGQQIKDPKWKTTVHCILKKYEYIDDKGKLQKDRIYSIIGDFFGKKSKEFYSKCVVEYDNPGETSYQFARCFRLFEQNMDKNYGSGKKTCDLEKY